MKKTIQLILAVALGMTAAHTNALGRGFGGGGFHGGGGFGGGGYRGGGGFGGGGFGGGDRYGGGGFGGGDRYGGGGFGGGGDRFAGGGGFDRGAGGFDRGAGGFDRGAGGFDRGFGGDNFAGRGFNSAPSRSQLGSFLGMPTDGGIHGGSVEGPRGGEAAGVVGPRGGAAGGVVGPRGAEAGGVVGPRGGEAGGVVGPRGGAAGGVVGPRGNAAGGVVGPRGNAAGGVVAHGWNGTHYMTGAWAHTQGIGARGWYAGRGWFTPGWIAGHPWAWYPGRYGPAGWATAAWAAASWASLGAWLTWDAAPAYYDYGDNVTYQNGNVYYGDQLEATQGDFYQSAVANANTGAAPPADGDWLPLGIFAMTEGEQKTPSMTFQLAINKQGIIQGNAIDGTTEKSVIIHGAADKTSQRADWTVGDDKTKVYETGLFNLTKEEAPGLIHFGADRTEQMLLVRLKQPDTPAQK